MAVVELGPNGEVRVIVPPTPEEVVEAEAALHRLIEALAKLAVEEDWAEWQRQRREAAAFPTAFMDRFTRCTVAVETPVALATGRMLRPSFRAFWTFSTRLTGM